jgi:hypothetical protein
MTHTLWPLIGLTLFAADAGKSTAFRYVTPAGGKYVVESEVTTTTGEDGSTFVSRTAHAPATMTLTVRLDKDGRLVRADALLETERVKKTAVLAFQDGGAATIKRGGITDYLKATPDAVVSTAPDWTAVFQLLRRYDAHKGGKQEFAGFWFHPVEAFRPVKFTIDRTGTAAVKVNDKTLSLDRYQVQLRDSGYLVWADADGKVCKVLPEGKGLPVVLEGLEEATKDLK